MFIRAHSCSAAGNENRNFFNVKLNKKQLRHYDKFIFVGR